ncbi:MAG: nitroreductase [Acidimicrobiales bacterium]
MTTAVQSRYSVRGYRPDPVPDEVIREVFDVARFAQSGTNNQPWHVAVVSGAACDDLRKRLCARFDAGDAGERDFAAAADPLPDALMARRRACGFSYYATMGVERSDREGRAAIARKNFELFDAPHAAFFSMHRTLGITGAVDMGILLQTVTLLMLDRGIGSIAQGALANYPDTVREVAKLPEENGIVFGMSFGYEDPDALINTVRMPRESLDDMASFTS